MMVEIRMPEVAADMTEADVVDWLAAPGDRVIQGEILLEIETDKSTVEIEVPATGVLQEIRVPAGTSSVPVGEILGLIEAAESTEVKEPQPEKPEEEEEATREEQAPATEETPPAEDPAPAEVGAEENTSPAPAEGPPPTALARRLAQRAGVDLDSVQGSGARGRILRADVEGKLDGSPDQGSRGADSDGARRRPEATRAGPPESSMIHLGSSCRVEELVDAVERINSGRPPGAITLEAGIIRAIALALTEVPEMATADPAQAGGPTRLTLSRGSKEPNRVIESAERMGLASLSASLESPQATGESVNAGLGILHAIDSGVDRIDPRLEPGQICALGIGSAHESPVVEDGQLVAGKVIEVGLAADGRAISADQATRFLAALRRILEHPLEMVL